MCKKHQKQYDKVLKTKDNESFETLAELAEIKITCSFGTKCSKDKKQNT